jgi:hypothetical protein
MAQDSRYHAEWETVSRYIRELFNYYCARCDNDCRKTKNAQMVLQVHHIDENPANNTLENLIPLCASCHLKIEGEARLHAPYREKQLELFDDHTYMSQMKEMRENALAKYGSALRPEDLRFDAETYETNAIEWEINESS